MEREQRERLQQLMVGLADGDRSAFDSIYATLWPLLHRFANRVLGGAPDAEDAAQVALMKVFSSATAFDSERDALSWILGITAYECKTFRQKHRRRREDAATNEVAVASGLDPEEQAIMSNLEAAALEVLGTLRPSDIETLRAVMEDRRPDVSAPTFRKRAERAITRLRVAWRSRHGAE